MKTYAIVLACLLSAFGDVSVAQSSKSKKQKVNPFGGVSCSYSGQRVTKTSEPNLNDPNFADPNQVICDPLTNQLSTSSALGIQGILRVKSDSMTESISSVMDYIKNGIKIESNLYFSNINTPTQPFTAGFKTQAGSVLVDASGQTLVENFSIEYNTRLTLSAADPEGIYELALLSDDGARMFAYLSGQWTEIVNNDGVHATRMGCGYRTLEMKRGIPVDIKVVYFQGPKYHVANNLLWRKKSTNKKINPPSLCGVEGGSFFFNPKKGEKAIGMLILESLGWKVISASNFLMPQQSSNPCVVEDLKLTNFSVVATGSTSLRATWSTNLAARSQIRLVNAFTGQETTLPVGDQLFTEHVADVTGLQAGGYYLVQAISKDAQNREVRSELIPILL